MRFIEGLHLLLNYNIKEKSKCAVILRFDEMTIMYGLYNLYSALICKEDLNLLSQIPVVEEMKIP